MGGPTRQEHSGKSGEWPTRVDRARLPRFLQRYTPAGERTRREATACPMGVIRVKRADGCRGAMLRRSTALSQRSQVDPRPAAQPVRPFQQ
jgi:hypothetical protein